MRRSFCWLFALVLAASPGLTALALELGEIEVAFAPDQRLDAEIDLTGTRGLAMGEIHASLASRKDFENVGLPRPPELTDLRFDVKARGDGRHYIHVTGTRPVFEPLPGFVVEVSWPGGRILKAYTSLPDLPAGRRPGRYGATQANDRLWRIAIQVRPDVSVSVQQTMLALQRANPDAFENNNINFLKTGQVLRIPGLEEIRRISRGEAMAEVRIQNASSGQSGPAGVARSDVPELRLLISDAGSAGNPDRIQALENDLSANREELDRVRRANTELTFRLDHLTAQVESLVEILKLKDEQLALLREEMRAAPFGSVRGWAGLLTHPFVAVGLGALVAVGIAAALIARVRSRRELARNEFSFEEQMAGGIAYPDEGPAAGEQEQDPSSSLDLAIAYVEMGDPDRARSLLQRVIADGSEEDILEARELLGKLD